METEQNQAKTGAKKAPWKRGGEKEQPVSRSAGQGVAGQPEAAKTDEKTGFEPVEKYVENSKAEILELTALLQRTRADFENFRKRSEEQQERVRKLAEESVIMKILPILDNFTLAINSHAELAPLKKSFEKTLEEVGIESVEATAGTIFNPNEHDAVMMEAGEGEKEVVAEVLRPGYKYAGEVIRAAMVKVKTV